jgi:predicted CXXCH cytochrome family protein
VTRRRRVVSTLVAALVVLAAAVAGVVAVVPRSPPGVRPELVPASWAAYRTSEGHTKHLSDGRATCADCHDFQKEGFKHPGTAPCARCHGRHVDHGHPGPGAPDAGPDPARKPIGCLECHTFKPGQQSPTCMTCHVKAQGLSAEIHEHGTTDCASCHTMHADSFTKAADCTSCHDDRAPQHARHAGTRGCQDCHAPHTPGVAATRTCATCHEQPAGPKPAGHESCIGCHQPHELVAGGARACERCHGDKPTLAMTTVPAHADCTSCHTPHAPARAADSCRRCHTNLTIDHDKGGSCIGCHAPHSGDAQAKVARCTSCHQNVAFVDTAAHAGGVSCANCHQAHDFAGIEKDKPRLCVRCHEGEVARASTSRGHADCSSCHGGATHAPAAAPACGSCHAKEQASAPSGHQACTGCHDPHAGAVQPQIACANCHADRANGPHKGVHDGCEACHRPHGPQGPVTPPACSSCHDRAQLPGLHAVPAHAECSSCHTSHGPPRATRAACTGTCHTDRRDHQPQATVCDGCHVFRR